jgi:hypothetical protein
VYASVADYFRASIILLGIMAYLDNRPPENISELIDRLDRIRAELLTLPRSIEHIERSRSSDPSVARKQNGNSMQVS